MEMDQIGVFGRTHCWNDVVAMGYSRSPIGHASPLTICSKTFRSIEAGKKRVEPSAKMAETPLPWYEEPIPFDRQGVLFESLLKGRMLQSIVSTSTSRGSVQTIFEPQDSIRRMRFCWSSDFLKTGSRFGLLAL